MYRVLSVHMRWSNYYVTVSAQCTYYKRANSRRKNAGRLLFCAVHALSERRVCQEIDDRDSTLQLWSAVLLQKVAPRRVYDESQLRRKKSTVD